MDLKEIIKILQSGDFTIVYWDNDDPALYKGKWDFNKESEKDDYKEMEKARIEIGDDDWEDGYTPFIVDLLIEALGGKSDSI